MRCGDPELLYLSVAATADHPTPLRHVHTARMLDQVIVCSANVGVSVARYWPVHIVKDGVFVTVQVVFVEPLPRATKERPQPHLRILFVFQCCECFHIHFSTMNNKRVIIALCQQIVFANVCLGVLSPTQLLFSKKLLFTITSHLLSMHI